jgi:hypothetical protein
VQPLRRPAEHQASLFGPSRPRLWILLLDFGQWPCCPMSRGPGVVRIGQSAVAQGLRQCRLRQGSDQRDVGRGGADGGTVHPRHGAPFKRANTDRVELALGPVHVVVHTELLEDNAVGLMPHRRGGSVGKEALQHMPKGAEDRRELPPGNSRPRSHGLKQKHPTASPAPVARLCLPRQQRTITHQAPSEGAPNRCPDVLDGVSPWPSPPRA